uniref:Nucleoprotein n=1 Tax=Hemipteran orthomyxo-related virus OKIAV187 TaxID=2792555 RepID=A0A7T0Q4I7_9ORTO|nr:nucleoprotein [Hemipteran orthomyxo-related virus OKIAV187]
MCLRTVGLKYGQDEMGIKGGDFWIGTMTPYVNFASAFKFRMDEIRTGHYSLIIGRDRNGEDKKLSVAQFGYGEAQHPYLEGSSYPPDLQNSAARSMGPLTNVIRYTMETKETEYNKRVKESIIHAFSSYDWAQNLPECLINTQPINVMNLTFALGRLCLVNPPKYQRRAYAPLFWTALYCLTQAEIELCSFTFDSKGPIDPKGLDFKEGGIRKNANTSKNTYFYDCSGKGSMRLWETFNQPEARFYLMAPSNNARIWTEVIYHAYWGSQADDFGVLRWMTGHDFLTRKEMRNYAAARKDKTKEKVPLIKITHKWYSKLTSGNVTGITDHRSKQITANPTRAGMRSVGYSADVIQALSARPHEQERGVTAFRTLVNQVNEAADKIIDEYRPNDRFDMGNTGWHAVRVDNKKVIFGEEDKTQKPVASNEFFLS